MSAPSKPKKSPTKKVAVAPKQQDKPTGKYAPTAWGVKVDDRYFDIDDLPSGQLCQARKLGMEDIIELNIVDQLDTFSTFFADEDDESEVDANPLEALKRMSAGGNFARLNETISKVVLHCVRQPQLHASPAKEEDRIDGVIYVDDVDFLDRMHIFGQVFAGLSSMSDFRDEPEDGVGTVEPVAESEDKPVEAAGD